MKAERAIAAGSGDSEPDFTTTRRACLGFSRTSANSDYVWRHANMLSCKMMGGAVQCTRAINDGRPAS